MERDVTEQGSDHEYWRDARRPLSCLIFLLPLLIVYEVGVLWVGGDSAATVRNGADYWMRSILHAAGFNFSFLLPILVAGGLLVWHKISKNAWHVSLDTLIGMLAESVLSAFLLIVLGQLQDLVFQELSISASVPARITVMQTSAESTLETFVSFVGAGVYEEVLFRLCLLPAVFAVFRSFKMQHRWAAVLAIFVTSLLFSVAHYVGAAGDTFSLFTFSFRMLAGAFFATLFVLRGFGITVGCHVIYDLLVGLMLVSQS